MKFIPEGGKIFQEMIEQLELLSEMAAAVRYPGWEPTGEEVNLVLKLSGIIRDCVLDNLSTG